MVGGAPGSQVPGEAPAQFSGSTSLGRDNARQAAHTTIVESSLSARDLLLDPLIEADFPDPLAVVEQQRLALRKCLYLCARIVGTERTYLDLARPGAAADRTIGRAAFATAAAFVVGYIGG